MQAAVIFSIMDPPFATHLAEFFLAASLANLKERQMMTVRGADRPVLLCWHEEQVFALDNRCPHMGFPLSKGTLDNGLLTCHWHHARFDLRSGCAFDLWADDTPMFHVCVQGDDIWVSKVPVQRVDAVFHYARLQRGLAENIGLVQAKNIIALLAKGEGTKGIIREIQAEEWPPASAERELLYTAICRHLAAHCPTRRTSSQSVGVALRLQKGEEVYAD